MTLCCKLTRFGVLAEYRASGVDVVVDEALVCPYGKQDCAARVNCQSRHGASMLRKRMQLLPLGGVDLDLALCSAQCDVAISE
jgi:hypothetical protein